MNAKHLGATIVNNPRALKFEIGGYGFIDPIEINGF